VAAILAHVAHSNQAANHRQWSHHHRDGEPEDLNPCLEGEVAELVGREAGDYLHEEDEEGPVGGLVGLKGKPPVREKGGLCGVTVGGEGGGVGAGGGRVVLPARAVHQFAGLAAGLLYSGGFNCCFSVEITLRVILCLILLSLPIPTSFPQVPSRYRYPTFLPSSNPLSFLSKLTIPIAFSTLSLTSFLFLTLISSLPFFKRTLYLPPPVPLGPNHPIHCKKRLAIFTSPAGMSLTTLSLTQNNLIIPGLGEFG
jgi:hypothetical protein